MNISPPSDTLLTRVQSGDKEALAELFEQSRERLRTMVAFRMDRHLQGRVDPSDILQDSFVTLSNRLHEYVPDKKPMSFFVWMRMITMERLGRAYRDHIQTQKRDVRREVAVQNELALDATGLSIAAGLLANLTSVAGRIERQEQELLLLGILNQMDPIEREIIALRVYEGLSNKETAEVLDLPHKTTSRRFVGALTKLRAAMAHIPELSQKFRYE